MFIHGLALDQLLSKTMAHFAQIDDNNIVIQVIVIHNNELLDNGVESETKGVAFCKSLYGENTRWVQTSYNSKFRKNYAGIGFSYLPVPIDGFAEPRPFSSWNLDLDNCQWVAPTPMPQDEKIYRWNEATTSWVETEGSL